MRTLTYLDLHHTYPVIYFTIIFDKQEFMTHTKTFFKVISAVFIILFLTSILTVESEQISRNSKIEIPVCVDSGVELAPTAYYDPIPYLLNTSPEFLLSPGIEHIASQLHLSSHLYRGPPATDVM
jgi:hypothetical protein